MMTWTIVADRTGWTPNEQDNLPWRYRDEVMSCFGLLDEVRANKARTRPVLPQ